MPKKKIGELFGRPIVIGDHNLVTKNEIYCLMLEGRSGGSTDADDMVDLHTSGLKLAKQTTVFNIYALFERDDNNEFRCISVSDGLDNESSSEGKLPGDSGIAGEMIG